MAALTNYGDEILSSDYIKACPFCGNDRLEITNQEVYEKVCVENGKSMIGIECPKCHAGKKLFEIPRNNYWLGIGILIGEWNRRCE